MGWVALGCYILYFALAVALRAAVQRARTGSTGFKGVSGEPGSLEWSAGILFGAAVILGVTAPVLDVTGALDPLSFLDRNGVRVLGSILYALGLAGILIAQFAMGRSWRIGVDVDERTDLVTGGPFAVVRNPIYSAMLPTSIGIALMVPNVVAVLAVATLIVALEVQTRFVEEPHLIRTHGGVYAAYAAHVGRFVPKIGRLRSGA